MVFIFMVFFEAFSFCLFLNLFIQKHIGLPLAQLVVLGFILNLVMSFVPKKVKPLTYMVDVSVERCLLKMVKSLILLSIAGICYFSYGIYLSIININL